MSNHLPSKIILFCYFIFFSAFALGNQAPLKKTFDLTKQDLNIINETLIWRKLNGHQIPFNFIGMQQLLPASEAIKNSIVGKNGAYVAKFPLKKHLIPHQYLVHQPA